MRPIDADALMNDICESLNQMTNIGIAVDGEWLWGKLNDALDNAPTIEPQKMRGKWNVYYHGEENGKSIFSYSCNQCGYGAPYNFIGGVCEQKKWNFCPSCGADMRGTE